MIILGIESTCDETGVAIVKDGKVIISNIVATQVDLHDIFGGVVPELACRRHIDVIIPVLKEALEEANLKLTDVDAIAVAGKPGLLGPLLIGMHCAKALSLALGIPYVSVNHIEAHLYAAIMEEPEPPTYPCLGVIISGGHTSLVEMRAVGEYRELGHTVDDAIGEAFDKVAKILGLPYPGGPEIEKLAKKGSSESYTFKSGRVKGAPLNFSFSGIKTAVLYTVAGQNASIRHFEAKLNDQEKCDVAASFQRAVFGDLVSKIKLTNYQTILFGGGVANSQTLRRFCSEKLVGKKLIWPSPALSLDNAAMIAGLGYHMIKKNPEGDSLDLDALPSLNGCI